MDKLCCGNPCWIDVLVRDRPDIKLVLVGPSVVVEHDTADVIVRIDQSVVRRADAVALNALESQLTLIAHDDKAAIAIA